MLTKLPSGFLALPAPGNITVKQLRRKLGLLLLHRILVHNGSGLPASFRQLQDALSTLARSHPDAVHAACGNLDFRTCQLAGYVERSLPIFLLALARALPRGALQETLLWDRPIEYLPDRAGGRLWNFDPPALGMTLNGSGAEVRDAHGCLVDLLQPTTNNPNLTTPYHAVNPADDGYPCLALDDSNPLAMFEAHPEKSGNAVDLGGHDVDSWRAALADAFELIATALPELHSEIIHSVERIVPVGYDPQRHLSASYLEAPGLVYMTLHPSVLTLAEAIIHESQHGKLNLLCWFDQVLENGRTEWVPSPVRPDLRPLHGVLLAVHAFVPVSALHLRLAELGHPLSRTAAFERRQAEVLNVNTAGLKTLREHAVPTALGGRVLDALEALHATIVASAPNSNPTA